MQRPFDVDVAEYPFKDKWMPYRDGMIHYVDEGQGPIILLLHGKPTWSYLYRNVIKDLSAECRLIALDYPGLGMSRAPSNYGYTPQEHSEAVTEFIQRLDLKDFVLVVQDWGGPIGLNYAEGHPENLRGIIVMNTWTWPATLPAMKLFSLAMGGWPLGYWLQTGQNFFAKKIVPHGIHHAEKITDSLRKAYTDPFPTPTSRKPTWVFPRQIRKARNGNYAQSGPNNPPKQEALADFAAHAQAVGNFIVGRRTFEGMLASGGGGALATMDIVVVSGSVKEIPGVTVVGSPNEALSYLREKGYQAALISGGADLHNAFLGQGLVDELIFNVAPVLEGKGLNLLIDTEEYQYKEVDLLNVKSLGSGVVQLHYAIGPKQDQMV